MRRLPIAVAAIVLLTSCGGDDDKLWPDSAPTEDFTYIDGKAETYEYSDGEISLMQAGIDALDDLPRDEAEELYSALNLAAISEDWGEVCFILGESFKPTDEGGFGDEAPLVKDAVLGYVAEHRRHDEFVAQCDV